MQSKYVRIAGIILAILLGAAALLYLGGLVSQVYLGYQQWLTDRGLAGNATMTPVLFSPLVCWRSALTINGLICTLFLAVLAGGLYLFLRLQDRFRSKDYDPRNFTRSKRGTYGTSGWMSDKEMSGGHAAQQAHRCIRCQRNYEVQRCDPPSDLPEHPAR